MAAIAMSAEEQLLLELVNRARANPAAEAARFGVDLNAGLSPGAISPAAKQPLAPHPALIHAAGAHADDMLARDYFAHTSPEGQTPSHRAQAAGYPGQAGENISWGGSTAAIDELAHVYERHARLFLSSGHRLNMLRPTQQDVGIGVRFGRFTSGGNTYNASMVVENFGSAVGGQITGVAFTDLVARNDFYDAGEGIGGLTITARSAAGAEFVAQTGPAGGYSLAAPPGVYTVIASGASLPGPLAVRGVQHGLGDFANTKVDFNTAALPSADATPPTASGSAANITAATAAPQTILVTYRDARGLDVATLDAHDLRITGPGGLSAAATVRSVTPQDPLNTEVRVEYQLAAPGGAWDEPDDGVYTVRLEAGQVHDAFGNAAAARQLTSFVVRLAPAPAGWHNPALPADVDNSGAVSLADALVLVAYLRENPPGPLPAIASAPADGYLDVSNDGSATLADLLAVVREIRESRLAAAGEAEGTLAATVDAVFAGVAPPPAFAAGEAAAAIPGGRNRSLPSRFDGAWTRMNGRGGWATALGKQGGEQSGFAPRERRAAERQVGDITSLLAQDRGDQLSISAREEYLRGGRDFLAELRNQLPHGADDAPEQAAF